MVNPIKIGSSIFLIILGLYFINKFLNEIPIVIGGIISISVGIGILASTIK